MEILSSSEIRLLQLVAAGETNACIAYQVKSTENAVKQMLHRIYRKLRIATSGNPRVKAAAWMRENFEAGSKAA